MAGPAWGGRSRPSRPGAADCPFPPHPGDHDAPLPVLLPAEGGRGLVRAWLAGVPPERSPWRGVLALWAAGLVAWVAGPPLLWLAAAAAVAAGAALVAALWVAWHDPDPLAYPSTAPFLTAAAGVWVLACARFSPLGGWHLSVLWSWALIRMVIWQAHVRSPAAREGARLEAEAAAWEDRKAQWNGEIAPLLGMGGWYLTSAERTLIGELWITKAGPGNRASDVMSKRRKIIEDLTHYLGLGWGDVDLNLTGVPGEIEFWIRTGDPWEEPVWHPLVRPGGEFDDLAPRWPATITQPVIVGLDPETAEPMEITLWDSHGAKVVGILATRDGGKTTLKDSLCAGILSCDDAELIQVNLSKALEDGWWEELAAACALGPNEHARASAILRFLFGVIALRPAAGRMMKVHQPTPGAPLWVAIFDELDKTLKTAEDRQLFANICSTLRSEGVAVVYLVQRGDRNSRGGADIQAGTNVVVWGKFSIARELTHVAGREAGLPDMGEYGGGNAGVFGIAALPYSGVMQKGRTFYWGEHQRAIRRVVADLAEHREPREQLEPALAELQPLWDEICGRAPLEPERSPSQSLREKIEAGQKRLNGTETDTPDIPDEAPEPDKAVVSGEAEDGITVPGIPDPAHALTLLTLAARPGGVTSRPAGAALRVSHQTVNRWLKALGDAGLTETRGEGSNRATHATEAGERALVPDSAEESPAEPAEEPVTPAGTEEP